MGSNQDNMGHLLTTLGEAHQAGAFDGVAAQYPWQAEKVAARSRGHRALTWVWVGGPLAAAAAVAVLFVSPNLFPRRTVSHVARFVPVEILPVQPELHADAAATEKSDFQDCDFNGDGRIDGLDIQAFVDRRRAIAGDPDATAELMRRAEQLSRCMVEGAAN